MDIFVVHLWNFTRRSEHLQSCYRAQGTMNCPTAVAADFAISVCRNYEADQTGNFLSEYQCEGVDIWRFVLVEQVAA
jgi:hypothetical protein